MQSSAKSLNDLHQTGRDGEVGEVGNVIKSTNLISNRKGFQMLPIDSNVFTNSINNHPSNVTSLFFRKRTQ